MKKITINNSNNHQFDANLILCFEVPEIDEKYIIYSFPRNNGAEILNIGNLKKSSDGIYYITDLDNDNEWEFVKKVMFQIVKDR